MEYLSIKDLAAKFAMPERTVYYQVANNQNIRVKKQGRSKLANVADFAKYCGIELQSSQWVAMETPKSDSNSDLAILQKSLQELQKENTHAKERYTSLEKVNNNLETNLHRYIQLQSEEKKEKIQLQEKYDTLQNKYHTEIQKFLKRYYLTLGFCMVLVVIILLLNFSEIINSAQKIEF